MPDSDASVTPPADDTAAPSRNATPYVPNDNISARLNEMDGDIKDILAAVQAGANGGGGAVDFAPVLTPLDNLQTAQTSMQGQITAIAASVNALATGLGITITPAASPLSVTAPTPPSPAQPNEATVVQPNPNL